MSQALARVENDIKMAMRARDQDRVTALRGLVNRAKMIAKNDKNREPSDTDVITALQKSIKELNETREIYVEKSVPTDRQDLEIVILSEYLPSQMTDAELEETIRGIIQDQPVDGPSGKSLMGPVMKILKDRHAGGYDPKLASAIAGRLIA